MSTHTLTGFSVTRPWGISTPVSVVPSTLEIDVRSDGWQDPEENVKAGNERREADEVAIKSYFDALWEGLENEGLERGRCESLCQRH